MSFAEALMLMWFIALNLLPGECVPKAEGEGLSHVFGCCVGLTALFSKHLVSLHMVLLEESCRSPGHLAAQGPGLCPLNFSHLALRGREAVRNCTETGQL